MEKRAPALCGVKLEVLFHVVVIRLPVGRSQGGGRNGRDRIQAHAGGGVLVGGNQRERSGNRISRIMRNQTKVII